MGRPQLRIRAHELRRLRLKSVLSRQQLADLSGVSRRRIDELEGGAEDELGVHPETARKLASALQCPVNKITEVAQGAERRAS